VITRRAVADLASPLVGTLIALAWGTLGFALITARSLRQRGKEFRRGMWLFAAGGIFSAGGVALMFLSLSKGEVVVVSPVLATNPLFTLIMASLLLRGMERISVRIVLGAILVVGGVAVLSIR
jgi:drug/metabolite transporter (DMT)-like permease